MNDTQPARPEPTPPSRRTLASAPAIVAVCICCAVLCVVAYRVGVSHAVRPDLIGALQRVRELEKAGKIDEALALCDESLAWRETRYGYQCRGRLYEKKGDLQRAIADYTRAIALHPENAYLYAFRGRAYEKIGDLRKAADDYCRALRGYSLSAYNPQDYAEIRAERKGSDTIDEMIAFLKNVLNKYPEDNSIQSSLSILRRAYRSD
ncbi:MAG: tetratricopeptide repeat protein [Candidatus Nealsonbacteria bacterium]|nr:tetratricopeptide repeat protein [Candidatus Nealsonbacteria bacterium]